MSTHRQGRVARVVITAALIPISMGLLSPMQVHGFTAGHSTRAPIRIGEIVPLTGPDAGPVRRIGAELAVREINAHGGVNGRPLKLIVVDDQSTPEGAVAAFAQLVKSGHITAVIATPRSQLNEVMTPSIKNAGIPVIIGGQADNLTHEGNPWVFRTMARGIYTTRALSVFTVGTLHRSRVAVLYDDGVSGTSANAELLRDLKALGVTPVADESYTYNAPDLTAQVLAIKKSGATAVISYSTEPDSLLLLAREMHQAGMHLTLLGNANLSTEELMRLGKALLYGSYAATPYVPDQSPEALVFHRRSEAAFHYPGDFASAYAYDGIRILAKVMRKVGTNPRSIRRAILAIRGYRGAMGTYNFDKHGDGLRQQTIVQNVHGHLHVVKVLSF